MTLVKNLTGKMKNNEVGKHEKWKLWSRHLATNAKREEYASHINWLMARRKEDSYGEEWLKYGAASGNSST